MRSPKLLLITNAYPHRGADSGFVAGEIDALSDAFDEVVVMPAQAPAEVGLHETPPNVRVVDAAPAGPRRIVTESASVLAFEISRTIRLFVSEVSRVRTLKGMLRLLLAIQTGRLTAIAIRSLLGQPGWEDARIYFFWGAWGAYAIPWLHPFGNSVTVRFHGGDLYEERTSGYLPFRREILRRADRLLTVSGDGARYLAQYPAATGADIRQINLGTEDGGINPMPHDGRLHVVSCSSVIKIKQVHIILEAVSLIASTGTEITWTHFGDGALMDALRAAAARAPRALSVDLPGWTSRTQIFDFYACTPVHAFVNTSSSEGTPVSVMEAMSFDIPVVAPRVGGIPDMLPHGARAGVLTPLQSGPEQVATAILEAARLRDSSPGARRTVWEAHYRGRSNAEAVARFVGA